MPDLLAPDPSDPEWISVSALVSGERLDELLDTAKQRWGASSAAAAALAWRSYTYWLVLPLVLGWSGAGRVPLPAPEDVWLRATASHSRPPLTLGLRPPEPDVMVVTSEAELLERLRSTLREGHLDRLLTQIQTRVNLGTRTLLGSLASAVAYAVVRGLDAPPDHLIETAGTLLSALDVADLVVVEPGLTVRRRTCCLAFTLPEPKLCSGCCIRTRLNEIG